MRRRPLAAGVSVAVAVVLASAALAPSGAAAPGGPPVPGCDPFGPAQVLPEVPTSTEVIGIALGDRDVTTAESDAYVAALDAASDRVTSGVLGRSVQNRPLVWAAVGDPDWTSAEGLERLSANIAEIRDPGTDPDRASDLIEATPQVLWVAGNVHGGEESGTDAALRVLYDLAAREDCAASSIRSEAVVFVLPTQNPDGRELDTRRNALGFDMNRDWFARTQPETDAKVELLRVYPPQVFLDVHEMGSKTYFFPPNADPVYHEIGEAPLGWIYGVYGPAMQQAFARFKYKYFNGSTYDLFYMGYGDTVPAAGFGAGGMTFEKSNGDSATKRVAEQYVAIWATLTAAAGQGDGLLTEWREEFRTAEQDGIAGVVEPNDLYYSAGDPERLVPTDLVRHYFLLDTGERSDELARVVRRLQRMDVEVRMLTEDLVVPDFTPYGGTTGSRTVPAGSYWVPLGQMQKHWVHAMLHEDTYVPFPYFYDVTAWSAPLLGNVAGGRSGAVLDPEWEPVAPVADPGPRPLDQAPSVALWEVGTDSGRAFESAGWMRWYLGERLDLGWDEVTGGDIAAGALAGVDVLVMGDGSESTALKQLGRKGRTALADWVRSGGTLVALRESARVASTLGLTSATYTPASSDVPGALLRIEVDGSSPLSTGVGDTTWTMYEYDDVWTVSDPSTAVARYPVAGDPDWFVSGYAEGADELRGTVSVIDEQAGAGRVVLFASDPNYRAFTEGTQLFVRNVLERAGSATATPTAAPLRSTATATATAGSTVRAGQVDPRDALVVSVTASARRAAASVLASYGATYDVVTRRGVVSFRVDLGGLGAEDHPWARQAADELAGLGDAVVALRLP